MKKLIISYGLIFGMIGLSSCDVLQDVAKQQGIKIPTNIPSNIPLTNEEVIKGLKNALNVGIDSSVFSLSKTNGYWGNE